MTAGSSGRRPAGSGYGGGAPRAGSTLPSLPIHVRGLPSVEAMASGGLDGWTTQYRSMGSWAATSPQARASRPATNACRTPVCSAMARKLDAPQSRFTSTEHAPTASTARLETTAAAWLGSATSTRSPAETPEAARWPARARTRAARSPYESWTSGVATARAAGVRSACSKSQRLRNGALIGPPA